MKDNENENYLIYYDELKNYKDFMMLSSKIKKNLLNHKKNL